MLHTRKFHQFPFHIFVFLFSGFIHSLCGYKNSFNTNCKLVYLPTEIPYLFHCYTMYTVYLPHGSAIKLLYSVKRKTHSADGKVIQHNTHIKLNAHYRCIKIHKNRKRKRKSNDQIRTFFHNIITVDDLALLYRTLGK